LTMSARVTLVLWAAAHARSNNSSKSSCHKISPILPFDVHCV
jgi:hypothetical protein